MIDVLVIAAGFALALVAARAYDRWENRRVERDIAEALELVRRRCPDEVESSYWTRDLAGRSS